MLHCVGHSLGSRESVLPGAPGSSLCSLGAPLPRKYFLLIFVHPNIFFHKCCCTHSSENDLCSRQSILLELQTYSPLLPQHVAPPNNFWWIAVALGPSSKKCNRRHGGYYNRRQEGRGSQRSLKTRYCGGWHCNRRHLEDGSLDKSQNKTLWGKHCHGRCLETRHHDGGK